VPATAKQPRVKRGAKYQRIIMSTRAKVSSFLGSLAGFFLSTFGKSPDKPTVEDFKRAEFKTSTQRLGIRFSERIRDVFRFKWLKKL